MRTFTCKRCNQGFKSNLARPPCPHGCRYPIEMSSVSADLITTELVDPVESKPPKPNPAESDIKPPKRKAKGKGKDKPNKGNGVAETPQLGPISATEIHPEAVRLKDDVILTGLEPESPALPEEKKVDSGNLF